jgi:glycosyltransferase involved in cell wall biosynthesis
MNAEPLRVLHVLQYTHGYGAERQVAQLLPGLKAVGFDVGVLTVYSSAGEGSELPEYPVIDAARKTRRDFTFVRRLLAGVHAFRPDIVHTHTLSGRYWGRFAAAAAGTRAIVHTEHNPCDPRRSIWQRLADQALSRYTTRFVTFFPEQGATTARNGSVGEEKIAIIPNGLDFERMREPDRFGARRALELSNEEFCIAVVGRLHYQKNHELALRAIAAIPERERQTLTMIFFGAGALEAELRALAVSLRVADRIRFLGYRADAAELLAGVDLLLMTSRFEGMPLTLLEAMYARVPIVTTPWVGSRSMLRGGEYGRITHGWSPEDVAAEVAIARAERSRNGERVSRIREDAMSEFSLARMVSAHARLYTALAAPLGAVA